MTKETIKDIANYILLTLITLAGVFFLVCFGLGIISGQVH